MTKAYISIEKVSKKVIEKLTKVVYQRLYFN